MSYPKCKGPRRRIYIAGPMRGYPSFNFPEFFKAARGLREQGWMVANPAEMDTMLGFDPTKSMEEQGFCHKNAIMRDLHLIADECQAIYLLRGWEASRGARAEHSLAEYLQIEIYSQ